MSLVISNMDTWPFLKISFSLASALIMVFLALSCRPFFLMYSHTLRVTSVRGTGLSPMTAASIALGVMGFMKAALGVRFFLGAAFFAGAFFAAAFLAGAFFAAAFFAGAFLAAGFLAGAFFAAAFFAGAFFAAFFAVAIAAFSDNVFEWSL